MERVLKWSSIASLYALVFTLAIQIAPRFIQRADAYPYGEDEAVAQLEQSLAVHRRETRGGNDAATRDEDDAIARSRHRIDASHRRHDDEVRDGRRAKGEHERVDVEKEDLAERDEALRNEDEADVKYYLIPVPEDSTGK